MFKNGWIKVLKGSGFVKALEELTQEGVERGIRNALGMETEGDTPQTQVVSVTSMSPAPAPPPLPVPRPHLIGADDGKHGEVDRPGEVPKRLRKKRLQDPIKSDEAATGEDATEEGVPS